jgi:hypothetical protein
MQLSTEKVGVRVPPSALSEAFTFQPGPCSRLGLTLPQARTRPDAPRVSAFTTSGAIAYGVSGVGLAPLNLSTGPKQGRIRAGQSQTGRPDPGQRVAASPTTPAAKR